MICLRLYAPPLAISIRTYIQTYVSTHLLPTHLPTYPPTTRQTDKQTDRRTDIHMYTHTHIHTYIHMYIHTHIHTNKHAQIQRDKDTRIDDDQAIRPFTDGGGTVHDQDWNHDHDRGVGGGQQQMRICSEGGGQLDAYNETRCSWEGAWLIARRWWILYLWTVFF